MIDTVVIPLLKIAVLLNAVLVSVTFMTFFTPYSSLYLSALARASSTSCLVATLTPQ